MVERVKNPVCEMNVDAECEKHIKLNPDRFSILRPWVL